VDLEGTFLVARCDAAAAYDSGFSYEVSDHEFPWHVLYDDDGERVGVVQGAFLDLNLVAAR